MATRRRWANKHMRTGSPGPRLVVPKNGRTCEDVLHKVLVQTVPGKVLSVRFIELKVADVTQRRQGLPHPQESYHSPLLGPVVCYSAPMPTNPAPGVETIAPADFDDPNTLADALEAVRTRPGARCLLLDLTTDGEAPLLDDATLRAFLLYTLPVVAVAAGDITAGALDLALEADIRICAAGTRWRERQPSIHHWRVTRDLRLCPSLGMRRALAGRRWATAQEALDCGFVAAVLPQSKALQEGQRIAAVIASRGPIATQFGKEAVWRGLDLPFVAALRFETDLTLMLQTTKDRAEGIAAFMEKRLPEFTGE